MDISQPININPYPRRPRMVMLVGDNVFATAFMFKTGATALGILKDEDGYYTIFHPQYADHLQNAWQEYDKGEYLVPEKGYQEFVEECNDELIVIMHDIVRDRGRGEEV